MTQPTSTRRNRSLTALIFMVGLAAGPLHAACFADYRASMDQPFRLHYGVIELPDSACSVGAAAPVVAGRIAVEGWQLLEVISVFDEAGLPARRDDAGAFYLRF
ncbi:MAG: hypothetical protein AAF376_00255 [Pseudomonadota bacterium]